MFDLGWLQAISNGFQTIALQYLSTLISNWLSFKTLATSRYYILRKALFKVKRKEMEREFFCMSDISLQVMVPNIIEILTMSS